MRPDRDILQFALHIAAALHLGGNESYPGNSSPRAASPTMR
ncbi:hypothetical protein NSERUTF1_3431 [Nocardia seriolae]|nr:hypothetical protein NSERUTF1_3431 [Nocardia seriolae]